MGKISLIPVLTFSGLADYLFLAGGIVIGTVIFQAPMDTIEANLKSTSGGV